MKQEFKDLAKYRLERARDTLLDAQKYFKDATLNSTVNRIYYAMIIIKGTPFDLVKRGLTIPNVLGYHHPRAIRRSDRNHI